MSALNKAAGILLLLGAFGVTVVGAVVPIAWPLPFSGLIMFILALVILGHARKLGRLEPGARESQTAIAVIMLFFPPFVTALGIYSLIVMTSSRTRKAFGYGWDVLTRRPESIATRPTVIEHKRKRTEHPEAASFLMRTFTVLAILWSLWVGIMALDVISGSHVVSADMDDYWSLAHVTAVAAGFSLLVGLRRLIGRKRRRGLGLAMVSFCFLATAATFLYSALDRSEARTRMAWGHGIHYVMPDSVIRVFRSPQWEISK